MIDKFTLAVNRAFQQKGYLAHQPYNVPEIKASLYVQTTMPMRLGFAKVLDHFLFIDADGTVFNRLDLIKEIYKHFSTQVNLGFKTRHSLRILSPTLPLSLSRRRDFPKRCFPLPVPAAWNPGMAVKQAR